MRFPIDEAVRGGLDFNDCLEMAGVFQRSGLVDYFNANYGRIESLLIDALSVAEVSPPQTAEPAPDIMEWHGRYVLNPNRFETFRYLDTVFGTIEIFGDAETLIMASFQQNPRQLRPIGGRLYSADDRATSSHVFLRGNEGEHLISDGFKTFEKVSTTYLVAHWASIFLGIVGLTWLFAAGFISLVRYRAKMLRRPEAPAFIALLLLFVPVPFFVTQSFMALGDLTLASALLAVATFLLPIGMFLTITRVTKTRIKSRPTSKTKSNSG